MRYFVMHIVLKNSVHINYTTILLTRFKGVTKTGLIYKRPSLRFYKGICVFVAGQRRREF